MRKTGVFASAVYSKPDLVSDEGTGRPAAARSVASLESPPG